MEEQPASKRRSVFKRGQKQELFDDGQEPDEQAELLGKLGELHSVWAMERTGRDLAAAIWRPELGLAEVVLQKGKLLAHMGFMRGSKLYLFIEEAVYLLDRANLLLFLHQAHSGTDSSGRRWQQSQQQRLLSLAEAHDLMLATGVSMDRYLVFCKLLRAGYIVQRHPARWLLRPGEGPVQAWAGWGQAPAMAAGGKQQQVCGARSAVVQQCQQQQVQQQQPLAAARAGSTVPTPPAALPAGRTPKRPKVQPQQQRSGTWWVSGPASVQQQQQGQLHDVHSSSANPWLRCLPANFLDSLPRCTVLPDAAQRARAAFPCMAPLQAIPLAELQPPTGPSGGHHLLHYDVFNSNSRFSRKAPGNPAFVVSVLPCTALPTPQDMSAADAAADGVPVRFSTIEKGDICYYGLAHVELRSILPS